MSDLQERVARAIGPVSVGGGVGALVSPLSHIIERGLQSTLYHGAPTTEFAQQIINQIVQAAIAECNRWAPIDQAKKDGKDILLFESGVVRLGFWNTARGGVWSVWPSRVKANPTLFQYITHPEASHE